MKVVAHEAAVPQKTTFLSPLPNCNQVPAHTVLYLDAEKYNKEVTADDKSLHLQGMRSMTVLQTRI